MMRYREQTTETAGFYNTVGFNDDTRAFLSIPARHDVARRVDCAFLARWVVEHRLDESSARAHCARSRVSPAEKGLPALATRPSHCLGRVARTGGAAYRVQSAAVSTRRPPSLDALRKRISSREEQDIDQLYGLEPVFEPGAAPEPRRAASSSSSCRYSVPIAASASKPRVDLTAGEREYIEDCEVCCRPIEFGIELAEDGGLQAVRVRRMDD